MSTHIKFVGIFDRYTILDDKKYYLIVADDQYLINCNEYPEFINKLKQGDKLTIEADAVDKLAEGILLENVIWSLLNQHNKLKKTTKL